MIDLQVLQDNPELAKNIRIETSGADLIAFGESIHRKAMAEFKNVTINTPDELLTPKQFAEALKVSLVTLWNWDKRGITKPVHIGNQKRYRRYDLDKLVSNEG